MPTPRLSRNDADVLAETDVVDNLVKLLDADAEDAARLAGLRAIHALATRQGEILRHRVGCRACVDAVWRQLQPFERVVEPTEEEVAELVTRVGEIKGEMSTCVQLEDFEGAGALKKQCKALEVRLAEAEARLQSLGGSAGDEEARWLRCLQLTAALLQHALGLGDSGVACLSVHATCVSFVAALDVAAAHLEARTYNTVR